ncbi:MAG: hypothetical protein EBQ95_02160 [Gammaproteobacteria bacterium]|nr:hypothetical protein [Gammaproteobacteria bacterium]
MQIFRDAETYVPLTDQVLKYLAHYKLSHELKKIRLQIFCLLKRQGNFLNLHPECTKYFLGLNEHSTSFKDFENEPRDIVKFKKMMNLLFMIENILMGIENTNAIFNYETIAQFHSVQTQIHDAVRFYLELNDNLWGVEIENPWLFSDLQHVMMDLLSIFQATTSQYASEELILSITQKLSIILGHLKNGREIAANLGYASGMSFDLLSPGKNAHFIGQLLSLVPYSLEQLTHHLKLVTGHVAIEQGHIPAHRWNELEAHFECIFSTLSRMQNSAFSVGSTAILLIYNLRLVIDFCREFSQNIGHLRSETQEYFKDKIRHIKLDGLPQLILLLDKLETQLMLQEGAITNKAWPYIEIIYRSLIRMVSRVIEFTDNDYDIFWLREARWNETFIQAHLKNLASYEIEKISLHQTIQNFERYDSWDLELEFNEKFAEIAPFLRKIDAKLYNQILHVIRENGDKQGIFLAFKNAKSRMLVRQALEQEYQQYNLLHSMFASRIETLERHAKKDLSWIVQSNHIDIDELANNINGRYALVMKKNPSPELAAWYFVDTVQKTEKKCELDKVFHTLEQRSHIEGVPQKLTLGEIHRVEGLVSKICDADMPSWFETSVDTQTPPSLQEIYFQMLLMKRAYRNACDFFNGLAKVTQKEQIFHELSHKEKQPLQNALNGFHDLVSIDRNLTVNGILDLKRVSLLQINNQIKTLEQQFQPLYQINRHQQVHVLQIVEREDYFLKSKHHSKRLAELQKYFSEIFKMYTDPVQKSFLDTPGNLYPNLNSPDLILLEPQQVVEQKLVYNILGQLKAFCENLESYKISNFDEGYFKLHLDIITGLVNFNNLTFYYFKTEHHFDLMNQFKRILTDRLQDVSIKMDYYGPGDMNLPLDQKPFHGVYEWIHRLYSLSPIIQNLNENTQLSESQVRDMREQFAKVAKEVIDVITHTKSYWWLFWHVPSISKLLVDIKDRFQEACVALRTQTIDHLYDLKSILFKDLLLECDQIELDLGIHPRYFSDQVFMMVDICFSNLLKPLSFDIAKFAKLTLKAELGPMRRNALLVSRHDIQLHQSSLQSQLEDILHFEQIKTKHAFKKILPYLVKYNKCRAYPSPNELLSVTTIEQDKNFRRWIEEICVQDIGMREAISEAGQLPNFAENTYNDINSLKNFVKNAIQGLIATDGMKLAICEKKIQHLDTEMANEESDIPHIIMMLIDEKFSENVRRILARMPFCNEVSQLCDTAFTNYMQEHRARIVTHMYPIVTAQMEQITSIHSQDDAYAGVASEEFYQQMNEAAEIFVEEYYQNYCQLHDILMELEAFEQYVALQQELISTQQFVWFESQTTLELKAQALKNQRAFALNDAIPIQTRLDDLKNSIMAPEFKQAMCASVYAKDWGITLLSQYFWQWMRWLGLYQFEQDKLYQNLEAELKDYSVEPIALSKYGLFMERHALYQDDFIQTIREGLSFQ